MGEAIKKKWKLLARCGVALMLGLAILLGVKTPVSEVQAATAQDFIHYNSQGGTQYLSVQKGKAIRADDLFRGLGITINPNVSSTNYIFYNADGTGASWDVLGITWPSTSSEIFMFNPSDEFDYAGIHMYENKGNGVSGNFLGLFEIRKTGCLATGDILKNDTLCLLYENEQYYVYDRTLGYKLSDALDYSGENFQSVIDQAKSDFKYVNVEIIKSDALTGTSSCLLFEDEKFYIYDETLDQKLSSALSYVDMSQAIDSEIAYGKADLTIIVKSTYTVNNSHRPEATNYETWDVADHNLQKVVIRRHKDFTGTMVSVQATGNKPFSVQRGVTIDNASPANSNLTAVEVVNVGDDKNSQSSLFILRGGTLTDTVAKADGNYRGTGVLVHSNNPDNNGSPDRLIESQGGVFEIDSACEISGFEYGVNQKYGVTRLKNTTNWGMYSIEDNTYSVSLKPHNYIGKWDLFESLPKITVHLQDIEKWESGDIILASGYTWKVIGQNSQDLYWTTVFDADKESSSGGVGFYNVEDLKYNMGIAYYDRGDNVTDDFSYKKISNNDGLLNLNFYYNADGYNVGSAPESQPAIIDPYPVLRFQKYSVYNVQQGQDAKENGADSKYKDNLGWYYTLYEAVAASSPGDELVFYDNTNEPGTIVIDHNLTIRSSYTDEKSTSLDNEKNITLANADDRSGKSCTATWGLTSGSGIVIQGNAEVTFTNSVEIKTNENKEIKTCGNLTLDADGKGRVVNIESTDNTKATMTMTDGITITGGNATEGGGIYNTGNLYVKGGTFSNNTATKGQAIYQKGNFYLSGKPNFGTLNDSKGDVYLVHEKNVSYVITKADELSGFNGVDVTLGMSKSDYYDGRNVVVSGEGTEDEDAEVKVTNLRLFPLTNTDTDIHPYKYVYTAIDENAEGGKPVLELKRKTSDVTVKKEVINGKDGDKFTFTATLLGDDTKATAFPLQENEKLTLNDNGTYSFELGDKESVTFKDIPVGYQLVVVEAKNPEYKCNFEDNTETRSVRENKNENEIVFVNKREEVTVTVKKLVSGNMGDRNKEFEFVVKINGEVKETIKLTHGNSKAYTVPVGTKFEVIENGAEDYTTTYQINDGKVESGKDVSITSISGATTITFTNDKGATINTGVDNNTTPRTIALFGLAIVAAAIVGTKFYLENERNKRRFRK